MSPCIISKKKKKTGDLDMILLNDGLTINLPCEQGSQESSLGKRISWFFNGCPCDCSTIRKIQGDLACYAKE